MVVQKSLSFFLTKSAWIRWGIILGLTIAYILLFRPAVTAFGPAATPLVALPVIAAGWFFGVPAGLIFSILAVSLNYFLFASIGHAQDSWPGQYIIPGNLILILTGFIAGGLRGWVDRQIGTQNVLRSRERYFALTNIMTQSVLAGKTPEDIYFHLANHLTNLFEADYTYIAQCDSTRSQINFVSTTLPSKKMVESIPLASPEAAMIKSVVQSGNALTLDDLSNSQFEAVPSFLRQSSYQTHSVLIIPLITGDYEFGAALVAFSSPHHFTMEEVTRAELVGKNVTLALSSIHQKEQIQKRLKEANALAEVAHALIGTERVGLQTVLQFIVDSAKDLIKGADRGIIHLLNEEQELLIAQAVAGPVSPGKGEFKMHSGEGAAGQALSSGEAINIADTEHDPRFLLGATAPSFRSLLVVPLQAAGQSIGTISVLSNETYAFSTEDMEILKVLGTQAALAIENARLFETTQQRLKEVNILYQISRSLAASLDAEQLIGDTIVLLQEIFDYYYVQIYLVDPETGNLVLRHGSGRMGNEPVQERQELSAGDGIVGHVAETGEAFVTNNVEKVVFFKRNPLLPETQSEIAVPIKIDEQVTGVLDIQQIPPHRFSNSDLQLMTAIADQLAVVLQKARLYSTLQTSLQQEQMVRSQLIQSERLALVGRLLASVSHELNNPLQVIQNALFLLKEETNLSDQGKQDLDVILAEAERMAAMIERLRSAYRPLRVKDFRPVALNGLIEDVHTLITTHMRHKEIAFEFIPETDLPDVLGLPDQLRQVVLNLFLNAIEVMEPGGCITVQTQSLPQQNEILFTVQDTGPGIDPEIMPRIFDAFITSKHTGTGLGLTITHDIIEQHHGRIEAENAPRRGAIFKVWLPAGERGGA